MTEGYIIYWRNKQTNFNLIQKDFLRDRACVEVTFIVSGPSMKIKTLEIVKEGYLKTPKD